MTFPALSLKSVTAGAKIKQHNPLTDTHVEVMNYSSDWFKYQLKCWSKDTGVSTDPTLTCFTVNRDLFTDRSDAIKKDNRECCVNDSEMFARNISLRR